MATSQTNDYLLYEPDEALGPLISLGHGLLSVVGRLIGMAATTAIVVQASDQPSEYLPWLYSASLVVCGLGTIAQAFQFGRFGSGYAIGVVSSSAFIAMAIAALTAGGPALLSSVMVVSAILLFVFIQRLSLLRRFIFTLLMNLTGPRARRLETDLHVSSLPKIDAFLREVASGANWDEPLHRAAALGRRGDPVEPAPARHRASRRCAAEPHHQRARRR